MGFGPRSVDSRRLCAEDYTLSPKLHTLSPDPYHPFPLRHDLRNAGIVVKPDAQVFGQVDQAVGDTDHALFREEGPNVVFQVRNDVQCRGGLIRIGAVVRSVSVEELHQLRMPETPFVRAVHGAKYAQFRQVEVTTQRIPV